MSLKSKSAVITAAFLGGWTLYFAIIWSRALWYTSEGDLMASNPNIWGDWPVHFTMATAMAFRGLILQESPLLIGAPFRYPPAVNFLSALLLKAGVPFNSAFVIPSFLFSVALVAVLFFLYRRLFRSLTAAVLGTFIFLFNGGLGFIFYLHDKWADAPFFGKALKEATRVTPLNIHWISVIDTMMLPQRAFQLGFPAGILAVLLGLRMVEEKGRLWRYAVSIGLIIAFLPLMHFHSFLAAGLILTALAFSDVKKIRFWALSAAVAIPLLIPFLIYLSVFSGGTEKMVRWAPGWYADDFSSWITFWLFNWGITPFAAIAGAVSWIKPVADAHEKKRRIIFLIPFFLLFALLNLAQLQPWIWDNTKLLVWVSVAVSGLAGLWVARQHRFVAATAFILMTASGALDAVLLLPPFADSYRMYNSEELGLAEWAKQNTDSDSLWLTAPFHNNWVFSLAGRPVLMTYEGWMWTHGYDYGGVKSVLDELASHPENTALYRKWNIGYVAAGPVERRNWGTEKCAAFENHFEPIKRTSTYVIYSTKKALAGISSKTPPAGAQ